MRELMAALKAVAEENRVRILMALDGQELCVCQIVELLGLAPSTVSKHMAILKQARLVEYRKDGRWIYYRLGGEDGPPVATNLTELLRTCVSKDRQIREDAKRLRQIQKMDPEVLCKAQTENRP